MLLHLDYFVLEPWGLGNFDYNVTVFWHSFFEKRVPQLQENDGNDKNSGDNDDDNQDGHEGKGIQDAEKLQNKRVRKIGMMLENLVKTKIDKDSLNII